jgi:small subunit ribosomal protein S19
VDQYLLNKYNTPLKKGMKRRKVSKVWTRRSTILPQFIGSTIEIHNGKKFFNLTITEDMIGHKLGEFSLTRTRPIHKVKNNK